MTSVCGPMNIPLNGINLALPCWQCETHSMILHIDIVSRQVNRSKILFAIANYQLRLQQMFTGLVISTHLFIQVLWTQLNCLPSLIYDFLFSSVCQFDSDTIKLNSKRNERNKTRNLIIIIWKKKNNKSQDIQPNQCARSIMHFIKISIHRTEIT